MFQSLFEYGNTVEADVIAHISHYHQQISECILTVNPYLNILIFSVISEKQRNDYS
jgi:hypothetical protein